MSNQLDGCSSQGAGRRRAMHGGTAGATTNGARTRRAVVGRRSRSPPRRTPSRLGAHFVVVFAVTTCRGP